jgi:Ankyrin repeats (3 copies)
MYVNVRQMARSLEYAIRNWDIPMAQMYLEVGGGVNAAWNPLCCAIDASVKMALGPNNVRTSPCEVYMIEFLLQYGANADMPYGPDGETPLMRASMFGAVEIVDLLISNGVNVFQRNAYGFTALQLVYPMSQIPDRLKWKRCHVVEILEDEMDRAWAVDNNPRNLALAMGNHDRIGESSPLLDLDPGVVEMISRFSAPDHRREGYHRSYPML